MGSKAQASAVNIILFTRFQTLLCFLEDTVENWRRRRGKGLLPQGQERLVIQLIVLATFWKLLPGLKSWSHWQADKQMKLSQVWSVPPRPPRLFTWFGNCRWCILSSQHRSAIGTVISWTLPFLQLQILPCCTEKLQLLLLGVLSKAHFCDGPQRHMHSIAYWNRWSEGGMLHRQSTFV